MSAPCGKKMKNRRMLWYSAAGVLLWALGCGGAFNPSFINSFVGGVVPVTPGPEAAFVFVRAINETGQNAEFVVTIERNLVVTDEDGVPLLDDNGFAVTRPFRETKRLATSPDAPANELGVLFPCKTSPVNIVGLGESLLPTDTAVFVGGGGTGGPLGTGVPAGTVNPLLRESGDFACGDTIIFRVLRQPGVTGNASIGAFLLRGSQQPSVFGGPNTFVNLERFVESQVRVNE